MEYDVLSVTVGTLKRMDESKDEEQNAAYTCLQLIDSIIESSSDPNISTKVFDINYGAPWAFLATFFSQNFYLILLL
jgi:hypothetical protein